jgi:hypothetical protein
MSTHTERSGGDMERNTELERVAEVFEGAWVVTITNMWWLEDPTTVTTGTASCDWLGDSFLRLQVEFEGEPTWEIVFGRSDARDQFVVLYHDERGVQRLFDLTLDEDTWVMSRTDPYFHQRLLGRIEGDRMVGEADASDDRGDTWRNDFDLIFERVG